MNKLCECGCGQPVNITRKDRVPKYLPGHHMKGRKMSEGCREKHRQQWLGRSHTEETKQKMRDIAKTRKYHVQDHLTKESHAKRVRTMCGREPVYSPYLVDVIVYFDAKNKRWFCKNINKGQGRTTHAKAVYEFYKGEVPAGFHVHHKNKDATKLENDNIENLMLLPSIWNMQYFPVLAKGFQIEEEEVTKAYLKAVDSIECLDEKALFEATCDILLQSSRKTL